MTHAKFDGTVSSVEEVFLMGGGILFQEGWNCAAYIAVQDVHHIARSKKQLDLMSGVIDPGSLPTNEH